MLIKHLSIISLILFSHISVAGTTAEILNFQTSKKILKAFSLMEEEEQDLSNKENLEVFESILFDIGLNSEERIFYEAEKREGNISELKLLNPYAESGGKLYRGMRCTVAGYNQDCVIRRSHCCRLKATGSDFIQYKCSVASCFLAPPPVDVAPGQ